MFAIPGPLPKLAISGVRFCNLGINSGIKNPVKQPKGTDKVERQRITYRLHRPALIR